ncbi:MAG: hypothetical protein OEY85_07310 [Rhodospirillales bacterium]|nr:hypothetical protein [Rhodospirillales bacterium]
MEGRKIPWVVLCPLPAAFAAAAFLARDAAGPFWMWYLLDPGYFYLFDSLNLINFTTPGHISHPGTPVQVLGALVLKVLYLTSNAEEITAAVLAEPEHHLRMIGNVLIALNAAVLFAVGAAAHAVFRTLTPALMLQMAPFLSRMILQHAVNVKPESLLILAVLLMIIATVYALRPGALEKNPVRFAVVFGLIAGFGVAVKLTSAPVFLLPVFVLGRLRPVGVYGAVSAASFLFFFLPAAGGATMFVEWIGSVLVSSGDYGSGDTSVIDPARYPQSIIKLFSRPIYLVTFVLSLISLAATWRMRKSVAPEWRTLMGVAAAQLFHVLAVAKQPTAYYLIPSWVLLPLAWVLMMRIAPAAKLRIARHPRAFARGVAVLLAVMVVAGGATTAKTVREFGEKRQNSRAFDESRFSRCARVYFYAASSPSFALYLGDYVTGGRFAARLDGTTPVGDFWFENWHGSTRFRFADWRGAKDISGVLDRYPCLMARGLSTVSGHIIRGLGETAPDLPLDGKCKAGEEIVLTAGVDCKGNPTGKTGAQ